MEIPKGNPTCLCVCVCVKCCLQKKNSVKIHNHIWTVVNREKLRDALYSQMVLVTASTRAEANRLMLTNQTLTPCATSKNFWNYFHLQSNNNCSLNCFIKSAAALFLIWHGTICIISHPVILDCVAYAAVSPRASQLELSAPVPGGCTAPVGHTKHVINSFPHSTLHTFFCCTFCFLLM